MKNIELFKTKNIFLQWMNFIINIYRKIKVVMKTGNSQAIQLLVLLILKQILKKVDDFIIQYILERESGIDGK